VPFDDDAADDVTGFRPPPHPDDRLWRHPSEVYAAEPAIPLRSHGRLWPWSIAAVGTAGVMLAGAGTLILGVQDRATDGEPQHAAVSPFGSLPSVHVEGRSLAPRSQEGVAGLTEIARLADEMAPSLVRIEGADDTGSGVVLGENGLTLTSAQLVDGLGQVTVTLHDGHQVTGEVKGSDALTDIAVVDLPGDPAAAPTSDPSDVGTGEGVLAMGASTGGGRPATTLGPLSAGHHRLERTGRPAVDGLVHVAVPAQPAARGGPLVDQRGTVVGITVWTDDEASYATPIDAAAKVADDLLREGRVDHAWLGISGRDAAPGGAAGGNGTPGAVPTTAVTTMATGESGGGEEGGAGAAGEGAGAVVVTVDPAGSASDLLRPGDRITRIDDETITDMADLVDALRPRSPGDIVGVTVERDDGDATVRVTLAARPGG
jgi:S1-C subfamily serine protease